jgi:hypothetical protein
MIQVINISSLNNHVIGNSNDASIGDPVVQPGTLDLTYTELQLMPKLKDLETKLKIAEVSAMVKLKYMTQNSNELNIPINRVDAAMAKLTDSGRLKDEIRLAYGGRILKVAKPYQFNPDTGAIEGVGKVYKIGRTTGYTEGVVNAVGVAPPPISYGNNKAFFQGQVIVQATSDNGNPFSKRGDSGSGILNEQHELVGLLFAGSELQTLVNPIDLVLEELREASGIPSLDVII